MHRLLEMVRLADGTAADIVLVEGPDSEYRQPILSLLAHKGGHWDEHLRLALDGDTDALETRWYLACLDGVPVANAMTVERHGVGILGHVYTVVEQRQRGLCKAVLAHLMEDFRARGGRALLLGTGFESVAYRIYESFGFRSLEGGFMQYLREPMDEFDADWFRLEPATICPARWEHWPLVAMLGARTDHSGLRSLAWGLRSIGNLESAYCAFMQQARHGEAAGVVAVSETGAVVACTTMVPFRVGSTGKSLPGVWLVDAFAHSLHRYKLEAALGALPRREGKQIAFVPVTDEERAAAYAHTGFLREGLLGGLLRDSGVDTDVAIYGRRIGE